MARRSETQPDEVPNPGMVVDPTVEPTEGSVSTVQRLLGAAGYSIERNNLLTNETKDAIRHFQITNGLEPTGVVGRGDDPTWKALNK